MILLYPKLIRQRGRKIIIERLLDGECRALSYSGESAESPQRMSDEKERTVSIKHIS